jgi:hypothetical protein
MARPAMYSADFSPARPSFVDLAWKPPNGVVEAAAGGVRLALDAAAADAAGSHARIVVPSHT